MTKSKVISDLVVFGFAIITILFCVMASAGIKDETCSWAICDKENLKNCVTKSGSISELSTDVATLNESTSLLRYECDSSKKTKSNKK